jgi:hypothetical protein
MYQKSPDSPGFFYAIQLKVINKKKALQNGLKGLKIESMLM